VNRDILLLEIGFLTVIIAPFNLIPRRSSYFRQHDFITLWLVKWLLFRLMFSSGVVKLTSGCPTWWGLTALTYHYESQCIPTPLAWYAHHLPTWFQKFSVACTLIIQLVLPFMFFLPSRKYRVFSGFAQVLLMILIILTGNYNFFNWLTIVLCLALIDDDWLSGKSNKPEEKRTKSITTDRYTRVLHWLFHVIVIGSLLYVSINYFSLHLNWKQFRIDTAIAFSMSDLEQFIRAAVPLSIWIGIISLLTEILSCLARCVVMETGIKHRTTNMIGCAVFGTIAVSVFLLTLVPYTTIDQTSRDQLPSTVKQLHSTLHEFQLTSSYGLFRRMTGVGGRPEVVVEGSHSKDGGWQEYEFLYKPGDINRRPPVVAPHQPRLDWQMWFAALSSYQNNPWFLNLVYRLLSNETEVTELIAVNPFSKAPPQYIRAQLYHYHYTTPSGGCHVMSSKEAAKAGWSAVSQRSWWCRKLVREYLPIVWTTEPNFVNYLKSAGVYKDYMSKSVEPPIGNTLAYGVTVVRRLIGQADGYKTCVLLLAAGLIIVIANHIRLHRRLSANLPQPPADLTTKKTN
jgi:hypothetical protein